MYYIYSIYIYIYIYYIYISLIVFFSSGISVYIYTWLVSTFYFMFSVKVSYRKKIGLYSDDMCYDIVVVNKSLDFFWNVFNSKAIKACHTFIIHKESYLVFLLIYTHQYLLRRSHPSSFISDCFANIHL